MNISDPATKFLLVWKKLLKTTTFPPVFYFLSGGTHKHAPCVITHFRFSTRPLPPSIRWPSHREVDVLMKKIRWQKGMWTSLKHGISMEWDIKRSSVDRSGVFSEDFASTAHLILPHVRFLRRWSPASVVWRRTTSSRRVIWRRWSEGAVFVQTKEAGPKTHWFIAMDTAAMSLCTRVSISV